MNKEHNPIAYRITVLEHLWTEQRCSHPHAKLFSMSCQSTDTSLVEGFIMVENSLVGHLSDSFLAFRIEYETEVLFYQSLCNEVFRVLEAHWEGNSDPRRVEFDMLHTEFESYKQNDVNTLRFILIRLLTHIKMLEEVDDNMLFIALLPAQIYDVQTFRQMIQELVLLLPDNIGIVLFDEANRKICQPLDKALKDRLCIIEIPNQYTQNAAQEILQQDDPQDPYVRYQQCLFLIGEAAEKERKQAVIRWGDELIRIGRRMDKTNLWATAFLVYAGSLLRFHEESERIHLLLDRGIVIARSKYLDEQECARILVQLYYYKGAAYRLAKQITDAVHCFLQGVEIAKDTNQTEIVINGYDHALRSAIEKQRDLYEPIVKDAFTYGYALSDEKLQTTNLSFIAHLYIEKIHNLDNAAIDAIALRMCALYGEHWEDSPKEAVRRLTEAYQPSSHYVIS